MASVRNIAQILLLQSVLSLLALIPVIGIWFVVFSFVISFCAIGAIAFMGDTGEDEIRSLNERMLRTENALTKHEVEQLKHEVEKLQK
jgi:uncharacterized protein YlxW (UPF0749 family)